jgi:hypothetical protein
MRHIDCISEKDSAMRVKIIISTSFLAGLLFILGSFSGCSSTKPAQTPADNAALEQARISAQNSEQKLSELRQERMKLEETLTKKQEELRKTESARDSLKQKSIPAASADTLKQKPVTVKQTVPDDTLKSKSLDTLSPKKAQ